MKTTEDILKAKYPKPVDPLQPEVDPEFEEHKNCQRRLDQFIEKQRLERQEQGLRNYAALPESVRKLLESIDD